MQTQRTNLVWYHPSSLHSLPGADAGSSILFILTTHLSSLFGFFFQLIPRSALQFFVFAPLAKMGPEA